jgi:hypothetical protein
MGSQDSIRNAALRQLRHRERTSAELYWRIAACHLAEFRLRARRDVPRNARHGKNSIEKKAGTAVAQNGGQLLLELTDHIGHGYL